MTKSKVHISLDTYTLACSPQEIAATFAWLLEEMKAASPRLRPDERAVLRRIMSCKNKSLTVGELFPDFHRECEAHKTLRRLRAAQFIRPANTGRWEADEPIEVKPFGRLVWNHIGEAGIFGDEPAPVEEPEEQAEVVEEVAAEEEVEEVEIDLALPEVNDPAEAHTVRSKNAAAWDDDDVLDFLKDTKSS